MPTDLPAVVRVTSEGVYDGEPFVNTFHFIKADGSTADDTEIAALLGLLSAAVANQYSLTYLFNGLDEALLVNRLYGRSYSLNLPQEAELSVAIPGTATGNGGPPMLATLIKWRTDVADRKHRGRTYLCGSTQGNISTTDADRWSTTYVTAQQTRVTNFIAAWIARTDWDFIILSEKDRQANVLLPYAGVKSGAVDAVIRVQRRRRQGS